MLSSFPMMSLGKEIKQGNGSPKRIKISGRYPHLAMFNYGGECGTGALVPWAGRLWAITYSEHSPFGDENGLYEITEDLEITKREESIGGTPANRMIHKESGQLFIGPYAIDNARNVRAIPYEIMPGRPTANARHLDDPAGKIYYLTMEEGVYEVDVNTLEVKTLYLDSNTIPRGIEGGGIRLPGYHGKGAYAAQGKVVYSNNGRTGTGGVEGNGLIDFRLKSGCLATWDGSWGGLLSPMGWHVVLERQFTEVTGPGGIYGNNSDNDPLWSIGWDYRSLILKLFENNEWKTFRLPKADYSYEGLHGWHVEWPRIRQVGPEGQYLLNHHGMWFDFPGDFSKKTHKSPRPIASHLKITGDFTQWQNQIVFGCDDAALNRFGPREALVGQSQSNLWFTDWESLKNNGKPYGWGGPWVMDSVKKGETSDPFSFAEYTNRQLHIGHKNNHPITFNIEIDKLGDDSWNELTSISVPAGGYVNYPFSDDLEAEWIRLTPDEDAHHVTAYFHYGTGGGAFTDSEIFKELAPVHPNTPRSVGLVYPRGEDKGTLQFASWIIDQTGKISETGYYEMDKDLRLIKVDDRVAHQDLIEKAEIDTSEFRVDEASIIMLDRWGYRFRLPKGDLSWDKPDAFGHPRNRREIVTERDLFNIHGSIYCLPRDNSGSVANIKPIATHNRRFTDFCSWRGLLVLAGCTNNAEASLHHIKSEDGNVGLWLGDIDDLWKLGKPVGVGGPWKNSEVDAYHPSDPYIMTGYDKKTLSLYHDADTAVTFVLEINVIMNVNPYGDHFGKWHEYQRITVPYGESIEFSFPDGFSAHWSRLYADKSCKATAMFTYS